MGSPPDKNWQKFHHREDKVAVKAVPAYSEKHLNQNWQENAVSLPQKTGSVEPAGFYAAIVYNGGQRGQINRRPWSVKFVFQPSLILV
jgi:hypothetical protein